MPEPRRSRRYSPWIPLGLLTGALVLVLGVLFLVNGPGTQARAAVLSPEGTAGVQTTDKLVLMFNLPSVARKTALTVELLDKDGKVVAAQTRDVAVTKDASCQRFEFEKIAPAPGAPGATLTVRATLDKQTVELPLAKVLLVKAHETAVSAGTEFFADSSAALRCEVRGVKSVTQTVPLVGAAVEVQLLDKAGKPMPLFAGKAGANGVADVQFKVPTLQPGNYKLEILTKSALGEEKLEREIKVKTAPKVMLVTDKPLYQPGQVIHLRALALQSFDLKPVGGSAVVLEVEDAKGNKVFKQELKTNDFGVVAADFQLADEVNMGDYRIRAVLGEHTANKTVAVKKYVLPKFKSAVTADKKFYLPKETVACTLQTDYLFGKPVAKGTVKVTASTFDVAFKEFFTWEGKTDDKGHATFEVKLPDYFVGQPLQKGNALVKIDVKITDTADHTETVTKTFPVSEQPLQISLIPEGGKLVPGMENRVFAAVVTPDGAPAAGVDVGLWLGQKPDGKAAFTFKTNAAGLAQFALTPEAKNFRQGAWATRNVEMLGGQVRQIGVPQNLFDLYAECADGKGAKAQTAVALTSEPSGENVILRLDKAVYKGGDSLTIDVRTSAGLPTAYLDVVRGGQVLLTKWLDVKDGKAGHTLDLPPAVFGTLEVHAYQMLAHGEIIRDSRVVYVHSADDLKIEVKADKAEYLPGGEGRLNFQVTDKAGKPAQAALGVLIVDEAVYALQDMQPGLEKVYFTLQEELLKPQVQSGFKPAEPIDVLVREPVLAADKQEIAQVLLTSVKPKVPARWEVDPAQVRRQQLDAVVAQVTSAVWSHGHNGGKVLFFDKDAKKWVFNPDVFKELEQQGYWAKGSLKDPFGRELTAASVAELDKGFTPENVGKAVTVNRLQNVLWAVTHQAQARQKEFLKDGKWTLPKDFAEAAAKAQGYQAMWTKDAWGGPIQLVARDKAKTKNETGQPVFDDWELIAVGPDGKAGTEDDIRLTTAVAWQGRHGWGRDAWRERDGKGDRRELLNRFDQLKMAEGGFGGRGVADAAANFGGIPRPGGVPPPAAPVATGAVPDAKTDAKPTDGPGKPGGDGGGAPILRTREYFPETMLWKPALITDEQGRAVLPVTYADSITTWRLTASASSRAGQLGGTTTPLRVFQDFFVDIDLPVALTQNDEVAFPVAVYNYLKDPQTVKIELQEEPWFELIDSQGAKRSLDLKPGEVTAVKFRIKAKKIGYQPLTVKAVGGKMSDAVKRSIDVLPDGKKVEQVVSDRLKGKVSQSITIPDNAIPDASKLYVKVYPGVMSQVLEGAEGLLRLPGG